MAATLIGFGAVFSVLNWLALYFSWRGPRFVSPFLPAPSLLTTAGLAIFEATRPYCWAGLFTDYSLFALLYVAPRLVADAWSTSSFTRQELLVAHDGPRRFMLSLHRGGRFLLRANYHPGVPCDGHGAQIISFNFSGRWDRSSDGRVRLWSYQSDRELMLSPDRPNCVASETGYPADARFPYDRLDGLRFQQTG